MAYQWTASDFRAEIARKRLVIYKIAAEVDVYPGRLGGILNGKFPIPDALRPKLMAALGVGTDDTPLPEME
jgi:hypothetical protein